MNLSLEKQLPAVVAAIGTALGLLWILNTGAMVSARTTPSNIVENRGAGSRVCAVMPLRAGGTDTVLLFIDSRTGRVRADVCIFGRPMIVDVDPKVDVVVIPWNMAVEMDLKPNRATFDRRSSINGQNLRIARIATSPIRIDDIELDHVDVFVTRDDELDAPIVGRAFIERFKSYQRLDQHRMKLSLR